MNPYAQYQKQTPVAATRIDLLLASFDGAIERIDLALEALQKEDRPLALSRIAKAQLLIAALATGVRVDVDPELSANTLRLYEFATHQLTQANVEGLTSARGVLTTLREGFAAIRPQAIELERTGQIPALDAAPTFSSLA